MKRFDSRNIFVESVCIRLSSVANKENELIFILRSFRRNSTCALTEMLIFQR